MRAGTFRRGRTGFSIACLVALISASAVNAQQVDLSRGSVVRTVAALKPGQFVWASELAPSGPMLLIVNLATQRAILYRNGVPIGASTASTGRQGYSTPTGVFTILQKQAEHYSSKYDSAPMPFMQRLTWYGVALHAGHLPGYPASHGCIRLPSGFAKLLYGVTKLGMTVVITDQAVTPRIAPGPDIALTAKGVQSADDGFEWHPELSPTGPVSIIVSAADRKAVVLRNGVAIGAGPVTLDGEVTGTWAYTLRTVDEGGRHWYRLQLSDSMSADKIVPPEEWRRFHAPEAFKRSVEEILVPGTTIIVTPDSIKPGGPPLDILEGDDSRGH
jgi:hypothetical protein